MTAARRKELRWLDAAADDVVAIIEEIAKDSPAAAQRFSKRLTVRVERLRDWPYLGSVCPYYRKARQLVHGRYIVYYSVHRREVVIRAVVHSARLFHASWIPRQ